MTAGVRIPGHAVDRIRALIVQALTDPSADGRDDARARLVGLMAARVSSPEIDTLFDKPDFRAADSMISALESQR